MTEELINLTKWALENLCSKCGHLRTASEISASAFLRHTCLFSSQQVCCPRRRGGTTMLLRQTVDYATGQVFFWKDKNSTFTVSV